MLRNFRMPGSREAMLSVSIRPELRPLYSPQLRELSLRVHFKKAAS